jgi:Zn-dependent peptidase ImmA (M78 family)/transcriptional regulator with XRE-family HTH domain
VAWEVSPLIKRVCEVGACKCLITATILRADQTVMTVLGSPVPAVADEAQTVLPFFDGQRLRLARESLGVTQRGLADAMAGRVTPSALSQFEKGDAKPSSGTLAELAAATGLPVRFFARDPAVGDVANVDGFFRSLRATGVRQRRKHRAQAELVRLVTVGLERYVKLPQHDVPRIPVGPEGSRTEVEAVAAHVRAEWELPAGPVAHVIRCVERHGVVVCRMLLESETVDAFSVPFADRPIIVISGDKDRADRSRWDGSHELGHLVMHQPDPQRSRYLEDQANWFAAEFLLPAKEVSDQLPTTADWDVLAELKIIWGVSMVAILRRSRALGVMPEGAYVQALKTMSTRGWNRREPVRLPQPEPPVMLARAAQLLNESGTTVDKLADDVGLPPTLVTKIIGVSLDPRPEVQL